MTGVIMAVRRGVALLLCPALVLQACATVSPAPEGAVLGRSVIERGIELKADVDTVPHSAEAQYVMRLREGRVIPLILVIGNVDASEVVQVHSAAITLELTDGRILRAIKVYPVDEPVPTPGAPAPESQPAAPETSPAPPETPPAETPKTPLPSGGGTLRLDDRGLVPSILAILKSLIWEPIVRIVNNDHEQRAQRLRHDAPERLEEGRLHTGEITGGVLELGVQGDFPVTLVEHWSRIFTDENWFITAVLAIVFIPIIVTAPIWGPIVLIQEHYEKKAEAQKRRNDALELLEEVTLKKGEVAGGVLYFGVEGALPVTLATATLVVPVRHVPVPYVDTEEERSVRLPLGKEY